MVRLVKWPVGVSSCYCSDDTLKWQRCAVLEQNSMWISLVYTCTCVVNYPEALTALNFKTAALCAVRYADRAMWRDLCAGTRCVVKKLVQCFGTVS